MIVIVIAIVVFILIVYFIIICIIIFWIYESIISIGVNNVLFLSLMITIWGGVIMFLLIFVLIIVIFIVIRLIQFFIPFLSILVITTNIIKIIIISNNIPLHLLLLIYQQSFLTFSFLTILVLVLILGVNPMKLFS